MGQFWCMLRDRILIHRFSALILIYLFLFFAVIDNFIFVSYE